MDDSTGKVGAVVIGRNEGQRLVLCLASLQELGGRIVYVDSASTDGSVDQAKRHGSFAVSLDMDLPFTAARARAEGWTVLQTLAPEIEYVMFVDGDCEVEDGWLETSAHFLDEHPDFAIACGRRRERAPGASRYNLWVEREWNTPVGEALACGGDALMRCIALRQVGGFDPVMIAGEEPELCQRLRAAKWRIMRLGTPMTIHDAAMTRFSQWWRRAIRSGFGYAQAWHKTNGQTGEARLYGKELSRALGWAVGLPFVAAVSAVLVHPLLILLWPLAAAAQYSRLVLRDGRDMAVLAVIAKYAETIGAARYLGRLIVGSAGATISYK